jgi:hypothetical protein
MSKNFSRFSAFFYLWGLIQFNSQLSPNSRKYEMLKRLNFQRKSHRFGPEKQTFQLRSHLMSVPSNRVISSPFSQKTFFFTKFCEGTPYFFSSHKFIKKWFRCWHGHFWSWLTSKPLFFLSFFR